MKVRIESWTRKKAPRTVTRFLQRPAFDEAAEVAARKVLKAVRSDGNAAVVKFAKQFDGVELTPGTLRVKRAEIARARDKVDTRIKNAMRETHKRVSTFARKGMKKDWQMPCPRGGTLGEQYKPLERVGVYVPGGAAPLASTALMTATLAKVAGVPEIVACTPCGPNKKVDPVLLFAMEMAGVTEMYKVGGIQAIGLMAYGTQSIMPVQKIVGPGGTYVTAAKRQVYGDVALDMVAGPSEIAILADETADARYVAADLLSQAEHGTGHEKALLVTSSERLAKVVQSELETQAALLSRQECVREVMKLGMLLVVAPNLDEGMELINEFAPEHLELLVREPKSWLKKVQCAGAIFVGSWSPESVGDFVAGPSHVLPTGGTAALFSGLTVDDFRRRSSFIAFTRADLHDVVPIIETFGEIEGLDAHARSARIRFE
ncbi:MAG: histidinol dehydrogenase [Kiritimatiellae bacterium]|nr:histidinol dehydrogenase [Kiritimatiellia bacterium]